LDLSKFDLVVLDKPINKVRVIKVREVYNYASVCNVDITCSKEISEILFNVGLGNSTGSGFGTIYKTFDQYKF
jgi:CRISPR/Cas system endoribonuclease Cas6 (RAMP superfamily)